MIGYLKKVEWVVFRWSEVKLIKLYDIILKRMRHSGLIETQIDDLLFITLMFVVRKS